MIAADWEDCAGDPLSSYVTTSVANLSQRLSNIIIGFHMVAVVTYSFGALLSNGDNFNTSASVPVRVLILKMEFPFDSNSSPIYEIVSVTQIFHLLIQACAIDVLNALIITLVSRIKAQNLNFQTNISRRIINIMISYKNIGFNNWK